MIRKRTVEPEKHPGKNPGVILKHALLILANRHETKCVLLLTGSCKDAPNAPARGPVKDTAIDILKGYPIMVAVISNPKVGVFMQWKNGIKSESLFLHSL